jgi:hypothetical protein
VFHMDVVKVDRDVAYIAMVVHVCCKSLSLMFHLFFRRMLQACLFDVTCVFHTYVVSILFEWCVCLQWFSSVFASVSDEISSVLSVFFVCCRYCIRLFQN